MDRVQVFNATVSLGSPPRYLDLEQQINAFLCTNINTQVVQVLELKSGEILIVLRTPDLTSPGRIGTLSSQPIAAPVQSGQKPPVVDYSREQSVKFTLPPVDEPEHSAVESKPRFLTSMPLVSAKKRDGSAVLCQAGVFGVPPGTKLIAEDPPVPTPLISSDCDLAEWADLFSGVEKRELPDAGRQTGSSKRVSLRNSPRS